LIARLDAQAGRDGRAILAELAKDSAPDAVVLNGIGRIEVFGGLPLSFGDEDKLEISPAYVACAFLQPRA
jgi:hypothetical protein